MGDPADFSVQTCTASDGYAWQYRRYEPTGRPRGHVVCLHGIQSHGGWYGYSCGRLRDAGFRVDFLDRRGSGLNREARGDAPRYQRLVDDVAEFLERARTAEPDRQRFLMGISWGGKTATALAAQQPALVDGLVLICPGFFPKVRPPLGRRLAIAWARLTAPGRLFDIPLNNPELFTDTPRWLDFLREDSLSLHRATARLLVESVRLDRHLRAAPARIRCPVLLLLAGRDRIIRNERTRAYVERFAAAEKQVLEYPRASHTLEFEPNPDAFVSDLLTWLGRLAPVGNP